MNADRVRYFEYLRRFATKGIGSETSPGGQSHSVSSIRNSGQNHLCSHAWSGEIAQQLDEPSQRRTSLCRSKVRLVCDAFVIERQNVGDIRPHLQQHEAKVLSAARAVKTSLVMPLGALAVLQGMPESDAGAR